MELFYIITMGIAIVLLILILTYFGLNLSKNTAAVFPPTKNYCPDNWTTSTDGNLCAIPSITPAGDTLDGKALPNYYNTGLLISGNATTAYSYNTTTVLNTKITPGYDSEKKAIDFNHAGWGTLLQGQSTICALKNWANTNGIMWDGVSNYTGC
jgi:hypothetical protein